jgi:hypothetical protein
MFPEEAAVVIAEEEPSAAMTGEVSRDSDWALVVDFLVARVALLSWASMSVEEGKRVVEEGEEEEEEANLVTLVDRAALTLSKRELVEGLLDGEELFLGTRGVTREGDVDREGSSMLEGVVAAAVVLSKVLMS